jgi:DNA-binding NarL/FixJ family response regulator
MSPTKQPIESLTPREREVLALIALGKRTREIGGQLGITSKTVACHRSRILDKLHARNAADLTRFAVREGLV